MRTWEENKRAINQLWPRAEFTDEERRLWHDDLSGLNQDVLYDAIRNVKRANDTLYPQIKWFRDEYRHLERLRKFADGRQVKGSDQPREIVDIDPAMDARMAADLRAFIDTLLPSQWQEAVDLISQKAYEKKIELGTGCKLGHYLNERLGMSGGGRVS